MGNLFLTYNNKEIQDGFFAQFQRIMAIYSISQKLRLKYFHSKIDNITVTQLDLTQKQYQINKFLKESDLIFKNLNTASLPTKYEEIAISSPRITDILYLFIKSKVQNKNYLIRVTNPYVIIEKMPSAYKYAINQINLPISKPLAKVHLIVIHIRRGVTIEHVVPGEATSRSLSDSYYLNLLKNIIEKKVISGSYKIIILTDAPKRNFIYQPPKKDLIKWSEFSENIKNRKVKIDGHNFKDFKNFSNNIEIIRGGDLFASLYMMTSADYLIMSRSSMSYVGALLNKNGVIYYPPNFWHKPLKNWIEIS